jgi:hypothetical protein
MKMNSRQEFRNAILKEIKELSAPSRATDWRIHACLDGNLAVRLGSPGSWCPKDIEDKEFARYADMHDVPKYTDTEHSRDDAIERLESLK